MPNRPRRHVRIASAGRKRAISTTDSVSTAKRPATDRSPAQEAEMNTVIDVSEWEMMTELTDDFAVRLEDTTTTVPYGVQQKLLHHAILCEWPAYSFPYILRKMNVNSTVRIFNNDSYYAISTPANLCLATTPGFWKAYFLLRQRTDFIEALELTALLRERSHLLFTRETWEYILSPCMGSVASAIVDAVWHARCYEKRLPPWFMAMLLGAGVRTKCLTPFHYYSVYSHPLGHFWNIHYDCGVQQVKLMLRTGLPSNAMFLFSLLSTKANAICDVVGFMKLYGALPPEQRLVRRPNPLRAGKNSTALELLEHIWERRKKTMIPRSTAMTKQFERCIAGMKLVESRM